MYSSRMWREVLGQIIKAQQEKQRIARELGISPITLMRWVSGDSKPRPHNLRLLLHVLPEYRQQFLTLLQDEFGPDFIDEIDADLVPNEIPSAFYAHVMHAHCALPKVLHCSSLCEIVMQQALKQLDPNRAGMQISIIQCTPPKDRKVKSLREGMGQGTHLMKSELEQPALFFGREALVGQVVSSGCPKFVHNCQQGQQMFPEQWEESEESAIVYPIQLSERIAGCLLVSSTLPDYFHLLSRQRLVQQYADLITIAFDRDAFYEQDQIDLGIMPPRFVQRELLISYRRRIVEVMSVSHLNITMAERLVMQHFEEELLQVVRVNS